MTWCDPGEPTVSFGNLKRQYGAHLVRLGLKADYHTAEAGDNLTRGGRKTTDRAFKDGGRQPVKTGNGYYHNEVNEPRGPSPQFKDHGQGLSRYLGGPLFSKIGLPLLSLTQMAINDGMGSCARRGSPEHQ